jgi:predicted RNA-binding Zn-ribbon protein involved in translation (DUF1610 family)
MCKTIKGKGIPNKFPMDVLTEEGWKSVPFAQVPYSPIETQEFSSTGEIMVPDHLKSTFVCPECGSSLYGTSNCLAPFSEWVGNCHGEKQLPDGRVSSCHFTWPRTDDSKYFKENLPLSCITKCDYPGYPKGSHCLYSTKGKRTYLTFDDGIVAEVPNYSPMGFSECLQVVEEDANAK